MHIANLPIDEKYLAAYSHNTPDVPDPMNMTLLVSFIKSHKISNFLFSWLLSNFLKKPIIIHVSFFTLLLSCFSLYIYIIVALNHSNSESFHN